MIRLYASLPGLRRLRGPLRPPLHQLVAIRPSSAPGQLWEDIRLEGRIVPSKAGGFTAAGTTPSLDTAAVVFLEPVAAHAGRMVAGHHSWSLQQQNARRATWGEMHRSAKSHSRGPGGTSARFFVSTPSTGIRRGPPAIVEFLSPVASIDESMTAANCGCVGYIITCHEKISEAHVAMGDVHCVDIREALCGSQCPFQLPVQRCVQGNISQISFHRAAWHIFKQEAIFVLLLQTDYAGMTSQCFKYPPFDLHALLWHPV
jgi:hypothetical protein